MDSVIEIETSGSAKRAVAEMDYSHFWYCYIDLDHFVVTILVMIWFIRTVG